MGKSRWLFPLRPRHGSSASRLTIANCSKRHIAAAADGMHGFASIGIQGTPVCARGFAPSIQATTTARDGRGFRINAPMAMLANARQSLLCRGCAPTCRRPCMAAALRSPPWRVLWAGILKRTTGSSWQLRFVPRFWTVCTTRRRSVLRSRCPEPVCAHSR